MKISAFTSAKQSFASNTPIFHVYVKRKDGTIDELDSRDVKGPALGLVKRLNDTYSREAEFMRKHVYDFATYPLATSSIVGRNDFKKKHIIFGEDAQMANAIREDCYRMGNMTTEEVRDIIHKSLIDPLSKKIRKERFPGDRYGEQVGLVLYTDEIRPGYNKLNGLKLTSIDGRVYAELEPIVSAKESKSKLRAQQKLEAEKIKEEKLKAEEAKKEKSYDEGYLFDPSEFETKHTHWDDVPIKKRWKK